MLASGVLALLSLAQVSTFAANSADALFRYATNAYSAGEYSQAALAFAQAASLRPSSGTLLNLGNAEWQRGHAGPAILAWEQALWIDPFNSPARSNLRFGRRSAQLESPDLSWYEVVSSWLPANWWAWVAWVSLWLAIGINTVPGLIWRRRAAWHQAVAAFGLAVFLLSVPAHLGIDSRSKLGFIIEKDVPLRLTPTAEAQFVTRLAGGEPGRVDRQRGRYLLIRTSHTIGWIERQQFRLICSLPEPEWEKTTQGNQGNQE
ncbi:MAG TPA: hypothetical protein VKY92_16020 [Verrucomicrobiae bacterium]|nr:hypothetical protein [Verrucomicrobiae bacterium]